ncbi:MAG: hypothetical protein ACK4XJ_11830 [Fimbriimonadaceae bacterium]
MRTILLSEVASQALARRSIQSEDTADATRIEITAFVVGDSPDPCVMKNVVGRISLDDAVSALWWEFAPLSEEEDGES